MSDLEKWAIFFNYADSKEYRNTVNEVLDSKEAMKMAGNLLMSVSQDEKERAVFRSRKMYQTDLLSNLQTAYDNGVTQGLQQGLQQGTENGKMAEKLETLKKARSMNLPMDIIATLTGLSVEEITKYSEHSSLVSKAS